MNDQDLERLLKSVGPRELPPAEVERAVRERVHSDWQAMLRENRQRRNLRGGFALAASVVAAAFGLWIASTQSVGPTAAVGTLAVAVGEVRERSGWLSGWRVMGGGDVVVAGRTLETGADGRAAIALPDGMSLRVDRDTRIALVDSSRLRLERGTLYLDSGPARPHGAAGGRDADRVGASCGHAVRAPLARGRHATARARGARRVPLAHRVWWSTARAASSW